jgi:hypothetical protein
MPPPLFSTVQDASLQLKQSGSPMAGTFTANETSDSFDLAQGTLMPSFPWDPDAGGWILAVVIPITSIKTSATNETYSFVLQDSPDNGAGAPTGAWRNWSRVASLGAGGIDLLTEPGFLVIPIQAVNEWLRLVVTLGGTAPSLVMGAPFIVTKVNAR